MLFKPIKGKMFLCVCVSLDMLYSEDQDVLVTCKVRTLLGGEDSLLWCSQHQMSAQDLFFQVRLGFSQQGTEKPLPHRAGSPGLPENIVFTKDTGI